MKTESKKLLIEKLSLGVGATWLWEDLLLELVKIEGMDCKGREAEVAEYAARTVRGYYSNRQKVWDAAFGDNPKADIELEHILAIVTFEKDFTLATRPVRPAPVAKEGPKTKGEKGESKAMSEGAPKPPPAPPAPPKPEMAGSKK